MGFEIVAQLIFLSDMDYDGPVEVTMPQVEFHGEGAHASRPFEAFAEENVAAVLRPTDSGRQGNIFGEKVFA